MKRKPLKKGILTEKPKPIIIKVDPADPRTDIMVPEVRYEVIATVDFSNVFTGKIMPLPRVLISYLSHVELQVVTLILEESMMQGESISTIREISKKLMIANPTVSNAMYSLRKAGLLIEAPNGYKGAGKTRKLNFKAIQHLSDLTEGENPDVFIRIRKATRRVDILNMTKADIHAGYDNYALPPNHDPAEAEEYD